ncbi:MAG: DUF4296 domain-containing protein [Muribaculaceae bacterium]|jgi:hypothetical protein|nr:DUF4296 domain-containing protein [Muribaculaceae bacterium]
MRATGLTIAAASVILALAGCRKTPDGIIPPDQMTDLLIDMHKAEGVADMDYRDWGNDSSKLLLRDAVYGRYNADQAKVDSSLAYYGRHIGEYMDIYNEVITRLEEEVDRSEAIGNQSIHLTIVGDSANAWPLSRRIVLNSMSPAKVVAFSLNRDDNWENGDLYTWNAKIINARSSIKWHIGAEYTDGALEWNFVESNEGNDAVSLSLQTDSTKSVDHVFGYAVTSPMDDEIIYLDSISLMRERLNPLSYPRRNRQQRARPLSEDSISKKQ